MLAQPQPPPPHTGRPWGDPPKRWSLSVGGLPPKPAMAALTGLRPRLPCACWGGAWRADPGAVWAIQPLLEVARRIRLGTLDTALWHSAWTAQSRRNGPASRCREAMKELGLTGNAQVWILGQTRWVVKNHSINQSREWLRNCWQLANARRLAVRRPEEFGHLANGVDPSLTRLCLRTCPDPLQQSMRSLMVGDVYTDALVAKWSGGDGLCSQCGAAQGTLQHILWQCPGKDGVLYAIRKGEGANPLTAELMGVGTKEGACLLFPPPRPHHPYT